MPRLSGSDFRQFNKLYTEKHGEFSRAAFNLFNADQEAFARNHGYAPIGATGERRGTPLPTSLEPPGGGQQPPPLPLPPLLTKKDFPDFQASFDKSRGEPGYDERADFNNDGKVDFTDFIALGQPLPPGVGPQQPPPGGGQQQPPTGPGAAGNRMAQADDTQFRQLYGEAVGWTKKTLAAYNADQKGFARAEGYDPIGLAAMKTGSKALPTSLGPKFEGTDISSPTFLDPSGRKFDISGQQVGSGPPGREGGGGSPIQTVLAPAPPAPPEKLAGIDQTQLFVLMDRPRPGNPEGGFTAQQWAEYEANPAAFARSVGYIPVGARAERTGKYTLDQNLNLPSFPPPPPPSPPGGQQQQPSSGAGPQQPPPGGQQQQPSTGVVLPPKGPGQEGQQVFVQPQGEGAVSGVKADPEMFTKFLDTGDVPIGTRINLPGQDPVVTVKPPALPPKTSGDQQRPPNLVAQQPSPVGGQQPPPGGGQQQPSPVGVQQPLPVGGQQPPPTDGQTDVQPPPGEEKGGPLSVVQLDTPLTDGGPQQPQAPPPTDLTVPEVKPGPNASVGDHLSYLSSRLPEYDWEGLVSSMATRHGSQDIEQLIQGFSSVLAGANKPLLDVLGEQRFGWEKFLADQKSRQETSDAATVKRIEDDRVRREPLDKLMQDFIDQRLGRQPADFASTFDAEGNLLPEAPIDARTRGRFTDLRKQQGRSEADLATLLQSLGVLRGSSQPERSFGELRGEYARARTDIFSRQEEEREKAFADAMSLLGERRQDRTLDEKMREVERTLGISEGSLGISALKEFNQAARFGQDLSLEGILGLGKLTGDVGGTPTLDAQRVYGGTTAKPTLDAVELFGGTGPLGYTEFNEAFGAKIGQPEYSERLDFNGNGEVDFEDFLAFQEKGGSVAGRPTLSATIAEDKKKFEEDKLGLAKGELLGTIDGKPTVARDLLDVKRDDLADRLAGQTYEQNLRLFSVAFAALDRLGPIDWMEDKVRDALGLPKQNKTNGDGTPPPGENGTPLPGLPDGPPLVGPRFDPENLRESVLTDPNLSDAGKADILDLIDKDPATLTPEEKELLDALTEVPTSPGSSFSSRFAEFEIGGELGSQALARVTKMILSGDFTGENVGREMLPALMSSFGAGVGTAIGGPIGGWIGRFLGDKAGRAMRNFSYTPGGARYTTLKQQLENDPENISLADAEWARDSIGTAAQTKGFGDLRRSDSRIRTAYITWASVAEYAKQRDNGTLPGGGTP